MFLKQYSVLARIAITIAEELGERKHQVRRELLRTRQQEEQLQVIAQNRAKENYSLIAQKLLDC